jgi:Mn2+/Fe2+ NRAMP family transporter
MVLFLLNKPIGLILAYGVLGSLFMPFLAVTLLGLLNGKRAPKGWANTWKGNVMLAITAALFVVLGVQQLLSALKPLLGS